MGPLSRAAGCLLLAALFVLAGCAKPAKTVAQTPFVATTLASNGRVNPNEPLPGLIAPYQNVAIQSTLTEPADEVYVNEGDHVRKGEIIAVLDTADLRAQLESDLATAHADAANTSHTVFQGKLSISQGVDQFHGASAAVQQAQKTLAFDTLTLQRDQQLLASGYIAQQTVDQQETLVHNDQQTLRSAQATQSSAESNVQANGCVGNGAWPAAILDRAIARARNASTRERKASSSLNRQGADRLAGRRRRRQPQPQSRRVSGNASDLHVAANRSAICGSASFRRANRADRAGRSRNDRSLRSRRQESTRSGRRNLNQIVPGSTNFEVKVQLDNTRGTLRPGMAILGNVDLPSVNGVRIPVTAFTSPNRDRVLSVDDQGLVHTLQVSEVADDGKIAIVRGVTAGTRIVTDGQSSVGDGEKVAFQK